MQYDFSKILNHEAIVLQDFIDSHTTCTSYMEVEKADKLQKHYKDIFGIFQQSFEKEEIIRRFQNLAKFRIENDVPYIIISNEMYGLKNFLIRNLDEVDSNRHTLSMLNLFKEIGDKVAHIYLVEYIEKLISLNRVRRNSLSDLIGMDILKYYELHLLWLTDLATNIKLGSRENFPELDDKTCEFGQWMESGAKTLIQNNSKYKAIQKIHANLHMFAEKIFNIVDTDEYQVLIVYLEKCELISLSIGTELALIDNICINQEVIKDTLTGALGRQGLRSVFQNQYEIALATGNPFVLAMCDLDFFKRVNDEYGHVAGDKVLELFVKVVKENIRNSDVIIRYGGEEFIILLPTLYKTKGYEVLEKVRKSFEQSVLLFNGIEIRATVSIGMIEIMPESPFVPNNIDEYIMIVDQKLYLAKELGRNMVAKA